MLKTNSLSDYTKSIICDKNTEYPGTGEYNLLNLTGTYLCRNCGFALFRSQDKFQSKCGWPSFDLEINNHIKHIQDSDGMRTEILCNRCDAHLGHVFKGEGFTERNTRYCVNSTSLDFIRNNIAVLDTQEAIVAAGCFWGVEYYFQKLGGVIKTEVGYIGGQTINPTYKDICLGNTGHYEALRIVFDPAIIDYESIIKYFFEIHDFTQENGQGPDIGDQYKSAVFCHNVEQFEIATKIVNYLQKLNYSVATKIYKMQIFYVAENYHQNYYNVNSKLPYCHSWNKIF